MLTHIDNAVLKWAVQVVEQSVCIFHKLIKNIYECTGDAQCNMSILLSSEDDYTPGLPTL